MYSPPLPIHGSIRLPIYLAHPSIHQSMLLSMAITGWWFQILFMFTPIWRRFPFWLFFSKGLKPPTIRRIDDIINIICQYVSFIPPWTTYTRGFLKPPTHAVLFRLHDYVFFRGYVGAAWFATGRPAVRATVAAALWRLCLPCWRWKRSESKSSFSLMGRPCWKLWVGIGTDTMQNIPKTINSLSKN